MKDGFGDREPSVRLAAGKMVTAWFEIVLAECKGDENWEGGIMHGFVNFLQMFDVSGPAETIAVDALLSIFITRTDTLDVFIFNGTLDCIPPFQ